MIVGWCITVCTILQEHSAHSNLQQHYTSSQQLVQQLQVSVVTMVTCMLAPLCVWTSYQHVSLYGDIVYGLSLQQNAVYTCTRELFLNYRFMWIYPFFSS